MLLWVLWWCGGVGNWYASDGEQGVWPLVAWPSYCDL